MSLSVPNKAVITRENPKLGEALSSVETFVNANVAVKAGNLKAPPPTNVANPTQRPG
jgi:hypothetical protein